MEPLRADGAPDNSAGPHKDVTFGGVAPLAESDWRTGGDATRRMAAIRPGMVQRGMVSPCHAGDSLGVCSSNWICCRSFIDR